MLQASVRSCASWQALPLCSASVVIVTVLTMVLVPGPQEELQELLVQVTSAMQFTEGR